jgi:ribosomal-protein-alanine N-acetyltransferase
VSTIRVRAANAGDLEAVAAIQGACPEAAHWDVADYLDQEFHVAMVGNSIAGFIVLRAVAEDEREILNLAVAAEFRRRGVAGALLSSSVRGFRGAVFLEVRESNSIAIKFYNTHKFQEVSRRPQYYENPAESAIVMKFHSC